jgi:AraC family transcriptional regulator
MASIAWECSLVAAPLLTYVQVESWTMFRERRFDASGQWSLHQFWHGGELRLTTPTLSDPTIVRLRPGVVTVWPPRSVREYRVPTDGRMSCVHFRLPSTGNAQRLPLLSDLGGGAKAFDRRLTQAMACFGSQPAQATALVWMLLWDLAGLVAPEHSVGRARALVAKVQEEIELHLHEGLYVEALARGVGLSPAHLRRLFQAELGTSVKRYVLDRRVVRARHLLEASDRPVKVIAAEVGIPDLHHFNKFIRRELGHAPRSLRGRPLTTV